MGDDIGYGIIYTDSDNTQVTRMDPTWDVRDDGIYEYVPVDNECGQNKLVLPKDVFIEAYNKYIKGE